MKKKKLLVVAFVVLINIALCLHYEVYASDLYGIASNNYAYAYDVTTGTMVGSFDTNYQGGSSIAFGSDGYLYGIASNNYAYAYDVTAGTMVGSFDTNYQGGSSIAFNSTVVPEPLSSLLFIVGGASFGIRVYLRSKDRT